MKKKVRHSSRSHRKNRRRRSRRHSRRYFQKLDRIDQNHRESRLLPAHPRKPIHHRRKQSRPCYQPRKSSRSKALSKRPSSSRHQWAISTSVIIVSSFHKLNLILQFTFRHFRHESKPIVPVDKEVLRNRNLKFGPQPKQNQRRSLHQHLQSNPRNSNRKTRHLWKPSH